MRLPPPPLLPAAALARVARVARLDGTTVLVVAAVFVVAALLLRDWAGALLALAAGGTGAAERHGSTLLHARAPHGLRWLVASQLSLLGLVWLYATWRYTHDDPQLTTALVEPLLRAQLEAAGLTMDDLAPLLRLAHRLTAILLCGAALLYQGGLAWYYARQQPTLAAARR